MAGLERPRGRGRSDVIVPLWRVPGSGALVLLGAAGVSGGCPIKGKSRNVREWGTTQEKEMAKSKTVIECRGREWGVFGSSATQPKRAKADACVVCATAFL